MAMGPATVSIRGTCREGLISASAIRGGGVAGGGSCRFSRLDERDGRLLFRHLLTAMLLTGKRGRSLRVRTRESLEIRLFLMMLMADIVDRKTRSRMMSGIRGKDTKPEMFVRRHLHAAGLRYRLHRRGLPGTPDLVLQKYAAVVFVHGCFWHQHPGCPLAVMPSTNVEFWRDKLARNRARDLSHRGELDEMGYRIFVVWECELSQGRIETLIRDIRAMREDTWSNL